MGEETPEFQSLLGQLEGRLPAEFLVFLQDVSRHRDEKFALECLIDQLFRLGVTLSADLTRNVLSLCDTLGIDNMRRSRVPGLVVFGPTAALADAQTSAVCSLQDLIAANDPVAFGKAHGAGDLLIVRALREKFGFNFDESMVLLHIGRVDEVNS